MYLLINILTAIALSLDAFSLSLIYGTIIKERKVIYLLSIVTGIFHFIMPLIGYILSSMFIIKIIKNINYLSFAVFLILGIEMILSKDSNKSFINTTSLCNILLFAFTVSIDSFSVGITLVNGNIFISIILFSMISFLFTYSGLSLGNKMSKLEGINKIGGFILILLSLYYLFT